MQFWFTLSATVPSSTPVSLQGSAVNSTTIQLQWESPPLADQNGVIRSYIINISVAETGSSFQQTSETTALYISNLHPFYTYTLTVAAVTIGPGPYSVALIIRMPEDGMDNCNYYLHFLCSLLSLTLSTAVPSSAPVHLQGSAVNSTTIQLQWEPPPLSDQNGVIRSYYINVSVAETGSSFQLTAGINAVNVSTLHPFYTYTMTVAAVTVGPGPYGLPLSIKTPEDGKQSLIFSSIRVWNVFFLFISSYRSS